MRKLKKQKVKRETSKSKKETPKSFQLLPCQPIQDSLYAIKDFAFYWCIWQSIKDSNLRLCDLLFQLQMNLVLPNGMEVNKPNRMFYTAFSRPQRTKGSRRKNQMRSIRLDQFIPGQKRREKSSRKQKAWKLNLLKKVAVHKV